MASNSIPFKDTFPKFASCFSKVAGQGPLGLLDTTKPLGTQRVDVEGLRCLALTEIRADVEARVLDLPNYYDCRIENPPDDVNEAINEAIAAAGGKGDAGILDSMLAAIDDELEAGRTSLSFITNIIDKMRTGWPRQGTADRQFLESSVALGTRGTQLLSDVVVKHFPGAGAYADDVQKVLLFLVDTLFFMGDFISTVGDVRKELGIRVLSKKRVETIAKGYKSAYGTSPSAATVSAWCAYGQQQNSPLSAPDGTTGKYAAALSAWKSQQKIILASWEKLRDTFNGDLRKYIACNTILASWYGTYDQLGALGNPGVDTLIEEIAQYARGSSPSNAVGPSDLVMSQLAATPGLNNDACGRPTVEEWRSSVVESGDPNASLCKTNYWIPFWEDRIANFTLMRIRDPDSTPAKRKAYRVSAVNALNGAYFERKLVKKTVTRTFGKDEQVEAIDIVNQWKVRDFAVHMKAVIDSWNDWAALAFPYKGKVGRGKKIKETLLANWPKYASVIQTSGQTAAGILLFPFPTPTVNAAWFNGVSFVFTGNTAPVPEPRADDPRFGGVRARCPGGPSDTSCLPGANVLANRRPIGAKPVQIPLLIEWGGQAGPLGSPEFKAWSDALVQNGYPGYYIDYLASQVVFVAKPGATDISKVVTDVLAKFPAKTEPKKATVKQDMLTVAFDLKGLPQPRRTAGATISIGGGGWKVIR